MARANGILQIEGTMQDMTFYKSQDGHMVRQKGGVSKQRIETDPRFARTRENGAEFGNSAEAGKLLRGTLRSLMLNTADNRVTSRMTKTMTEIKNLDTTSERGKRTVAIGINNPAAAPLLKGFNFNLLAILGSVLFSPYKVDIVNGNISIDNFVPLNDVVYPDGATNVSLTSAFAIVDFATGVTTIQYSPVIDLPINTTSTNVVLKPVSVPAGAGTKFYVLHIEFFQMVNGHQYQLKNGAYNVLSIVKES